MYDKSSYMASRAVLGKYPMIIDINKKTLQISIELYNTVKNSFCSNLNEDA